MYCGESLTHRLPNVAAPRLVVVATAGKHTVEAHNNIQIKNTNINGLLLIVNWTSKTSYQLLRDVRVCGYTTRFLEGGA
jgi:hypothetical protein